jgi:hypothetical protein
MKPILVVLLLLVTASLAACTPLVQPTETQAIKIEPTPTIVRNAAEEAEVKSLVESFGKRLQLVSLLAPNAAQDLQTQYAEFVSPALLKTWMNDVPKAPGRMVSSPWPDRIEISALTELSPDKYVIDGSIIEITSTETNGNESANRIPVQIVAERVQGHWLITGYIEKL